MARNSKVNNDIGKKKIVAIGLIILIIAAGFFIFNYYQNKLSGQAVLSIQTSYVLNETLKGSLSLGLKKGELIPSDSVVRLSMGGNDYDYQLSSLISDSTVTGQFYAEDKSLSGEGAGYGIAGEKEIYPEVSFTMKINKVNDKDKEKKGESSGGESVNSGASNSDLTSTTEAETSSTETTTEESNVETSTSSETTSESTSTTESETSTAETSPQESTSTTESSPISETKKEEKSEQKEEKKEEKSESKEDKKSESAGITGGVVAELSIEIEGKTSKNAPYTYQLQDEETAEIISSSQPVSISVENNIARVTTDYSEKVQGFGQGYLGEGTAYTLSLDISSLNLIG